MAWRLIWEINPPRAIIVAGGGDYAKANNIADQTNDLGAYAYRTLKAAGVRGRKHMLPDFIRGGAWNDHAPGAVRPLARRGRRHAKTT